MEGLNLDILPTWFVLSLGTVLGLLCGSFLNVVIYRLPRGLNLAFPGSACPHCQTPIKPYDNIPVVSWVVLLGKSRCCKQPISPRYPVIEMIGGLAAGAVVEAKILPFAAELSLLEGMLWFWLYLAVVLALVAAAAIDFEHMLLPDSLTLGGTLLGVGSAYFRPELDVTWSVIGAVGGYVIVWFPFIWVHRLIRGFDGMGLGDAKLLALAGAWLGPLGALLVLFAGAIQGTFFALAAYLATGKISEPEAVTAQRNELLAAIEAAEGKEREELEKELAEDPLGLPPEEAEGGPRLAFGPFLALATVELLLFWEPIRNFIRAYYLF